MESLPEFCLKFSELESIDKASAVRLIRKAAKLVYQSDKFKKRGEFGELLLHVILREVVGSLPAVSKLYYKDSVNGTVKGFDAVHVVPTETGLELWLGEVKFYADPVRAIRDIAKEISEHLASDYLKNEFATIVNKIDDKWPHAERLRQLLDPKTSLDKVFERFCVPALVTYDGEVTGAHDRSCEEYLSQLRDEQVKLHQRFVQQAASIPHRIHLFLLPTKTKEVLIKALDGKLKAMQNI